MVWADLGIPVEIEMDCSAMKDTLLNLHLNIAHARWREGILAYHIVDIRYIPGKLNMVADRLSQKWENMLEEPKEGSKWTVSKDWEERTGLVNDIMNVTMMDAPIDTVQARFANKPVFKEVIEAINNLDQSTGIREKQQAHHRAKQYLIEEGKLWRLKGSKSTRARMRVECVLREEARVLAVQEDMEGGH